MVILNSLMGRVMIVNQCSADARKFVGTDRGANAAAADGHAAFHFPRSHSLRERDDKVGIIITGAQTVRPEIDHLMPRFAKISSLLFFQTESTAISANSYAHIMLRFCVQPTVLLLPVRRQAPALVRGQP